MNVENLKITSFDERRDLLIAEDEKKALDLCCRHFISCGKEAIQSHGCFFIALAGGSTPKEVYKQVTSPPYKEQIPWEKVFLFWSDERSVPPDHPDSNYHMAMEAGFQNVPILKHHIFRMIAEENIEENALKYEQTIYKILKEPIFDLIILGMGEDGHTASLFPQTAGLNIENRLVIANHVPQKNTWRMTFTFKIIHMASAVVIYVLGDRKKHAVAKVFTSEFQPQDYPIQEVGTKENKALWILDKAAASKLPQ